MSNPAIEQAARKYGLDFIRILPPQKGYRNFAYQIELVDSSYANLMVYKNESNILKKISLANSLSEHLKNQGLPVRHCLDRRILVIKSGGQERYASLYNYLPGHTIPWEAYTKDHLKLLGQNMARLHLAMADFTDRPVPNVEDEYLEFLGRMQKYFSNKDVVAAIRHKLKLEFDVERLKMFRGILTASKDLNGRQPLHMDFVRSNVLFNQDNDGLFVSGIIDFEKAAFGHRLFDICRTLAFLYVDCKFKTATEIRRYFLMSGYAKRGGAQLTSVRFSQANHSLDLEKSLIQLFWLHDFYKFLKHNPYEFLEKNEHFVRTRDMLLAAGLLEPTRP